MRILDRFLLRAPLLSVGGVLDESPLAQQALELASPALIEGLARGDASARAARDRYAARAAFRATPHGLLAGVGVGSLGATTRVATGTPVAHLTVAYARLAALARGLLDDEAFRAEVRLRVAPSLLRHGDHAMWLGPRGEALEAPVDEVLGPILAAAARWARFDAVAEVAGSAELVIELVDDALLVSDLTPPLVGPPPLDWMRARLGRSRSAAARALRESLETTQQAAHATLVFPAAQVTVARSIVERAARLAPTLVRLAAALSPPTAERDLDAGLAAAIDAAVEDFGPGALDLAALALGGYGVRPEPEPAPRPPPPPALLVLLLDRFTRAALGGEARFTAAELDAVLPATPLPPTVELQLAPRAEPSGWLLGWHAPAGATWGRFAHAVPAIGDALRDLAAAEPPGRLDVVFAPDPTLGDLAAHPPIREAALALSGWPDGPARTPAELNLAAPAPLVLQGGTPSPLTRLRSTTAPPGVYQLLVGWSLHRQHAPWALTFGPLAGLAHTPRIVVDDFVVAPASWRLPVGRDAAELAAWRDSNGLPRHVQIGHEDELLPVDLDAEGAAAALAGHDRVVEIWPPLEEKPVDTHGRRVEIVVAVVLDASPTAPALSARVAPPSEVGAEAGWRSFILFGPRDRQDRLLVEAIAPTIAAARAKNEIDGWFFLRYVDGACHELRLRVHGDAPRFEKRLLRALAPATTAGDLVSHALRPFFPERARYGRALPAVLRAFEAASDRAIGLLRDPAAEEADVDLVHALDGQAHSLGLTLPERLALATDLRAAFQPEPPDAAVTYRRQARALRAALGARATGQARTHKAARAYAGDLAHLLVNRLVGIDADREAYAYVAWQRTLEGLLAKPLR